MLFDLIVIYGVIFYLGAVFHRDYNVNFVDVFISIQCLMLGSIGMGKQ